MNRFLSLIALVLFVANPALAQSYPDHQNIYVNDYANVIEDESESRLKTQIQELHEETGVELTILTILTSETYQTSGSFEDFATGLFNHWGIGNAEKNDGILVLIATEDRNMRIELGAGYALDYSRLAGRIIDDIFLTKLRAGNYTEAIEAGTTAIITNIAQRNALGEPAPVSLRSDNGSPIPIIAAMFAGVLALIGAVVFGKRIKNRLTRCPDCGLRGMHSVKHQEKAATRKRKGRGEEIISCTHCDYYISRPYTISRISSSSSGSSSGGSFGGGSSSGGGASGSW